MFCSTHPDTPCLMGHGFSPNSLWHDRSQVREPSHPTAWLTTENPTDIASTASHVGDSTCRGTTVRTVRRTQRVNLASRISHLASIWLFPAQSGLATRAGFGMVGDVQLQRDTRYSWTSPGMHPRVCVHHGGTSMLSEKSFNPKTSPPRGQDVCGDDAAMHRTRDLQERSRGHGSLHGK